MKRQEGMGDALLGTLLRLAQLHLHGVDAIDAVDEKDQDEYERDLARSQDRAPIPSFLGI